MKTTRRGIFKLIAGAAACVALPVPKWHKPLNEWKTVEPTFEFSREIPPPLNKVEFTETRYDDRPLFWREKILKAYPNRPSDLMTILGKLRKP
jgi:hypothetical protein